MFHFELNLFYNDHFAVWFRRRNPSERNDHGNFNGQNMVWRLTPASFFLRNASKARGSIFWTGFNIGPELCRVQVRATDFSWVRRYPMLIKRVQLPANERIAGYEIALDFNGLPFELIPRTATQMKGNTKYQLLSVNEAEETKNPCRHLVKRQGASWTFGKNGLTLLEMLTD